MGYAPPHPPPFFFHPPTPRLPLADAGTERQNIETIVQRIFQTARVKHQPVKHLTDLRHTLSFQLRIIRSHLRTVFAQIGNHGNTRTAKPGDEDFFILKSHFGFILVFQTTFRKIQYPA